MLAAYGRLRSTVVHHHLPTTSTSPGAYELVDNADSLLDVSDLVFIDSTGAPASAVFGKEKEKGLLGVETDGHALRRRSPLPSTNQRWNLSRLFGEERRHHPLEAAPWHSCRWKAISIDASIRLLPELSFDDSVHVLQWGNPASMSCTELRPPDLAATADHQRLHRLAAPSLFLLKESNSP